MGRRIRQLRGFDMTQEEFARRIGVSQGHFSYIERGEKEIGADILLRISEEFEKSNRVVTDGKGVIYRVIWECNRGDACRIIWKVIFWTCHLRNAKVLSGHYSC